ncbi:aspartyl-phosphate phosphatase Spo0E family protein [Priestia megaterium]|jgi:stage 0 sporulation regulatory protein|uniref:aspartyl-phosphate phosphatase Spo0E family protein n=1 Tax=Priestia megaterium TaxID=1404 RepID=UPI001867E87A|nr:aspartyl-phosphate phosphatase Spo0E family protein [Priestia megaterium]MBE2977207.1 aspartyl-phosphate phosphatase Spo0E family protein [Priestia megaterium]MCY9024596.1 aspartyl-phosphate phosphatase Spo0E family protein [Priestia megaterium]MED3931667.1 aspartyl-phosphate phosphatase Spo0E family protein [Priestia megaterium]
METHKGILKRALSLEIEKARKSLIKVGLEEGFTNPKTLRISQFVDDLLVELHKLK